MTDAGPLRDPGAGRGALIGMASAVGATLIFSINDVCFKLLSGAYPLHELVLIRSAIGAVVMMTIIVPLSGGWHLLRTTRPGLHLGRAALIAASNLCYYLGLAALPLAEGVALFYIAPMMITALSVPLLGERVGPRRWAAVGVGLLGVLVMVRPGTQAFQATALLPVLAALFYALAQMVTRRMGGMESPLTMTLWVQLMFIAISLGMGLTVGDGHLAQGAHPSLQFLFRQWSWPPLPDWGILLVVGLLSSFGGLLIAQAYRVTDAAIIAPFEYVAMPVAVIWGLVIFGQWPDRLAWIGIALICGAGLYIFWRETVMGRR